MQPRSDPERGRRLFGAVVYGLAVLVGAGLLLLLFVLPAFMGRHPMHRLEAMGIGALLAFIPLLVYAGIPRVIDRFDPEPWWCLLLALLWGAFAACGFAAAINTAVLWVLAQVMSASDAQALTACVCAPFVEEFWKGLGVFGVFFFLRREFDGVVDGVIYATFTALGFAAIENVTYYATAELTKHGSMLAGTFLIRGVLAPWGHPLYTSMTGLGFGLSRETTKPWLRWGAPFLGYLAAVFLHSLWNSAAELSGMLFLVMLPLWLMFVTAFLGILMWLVARKGRIIRDNLRDEVLLGYLSAAELTLVASPIGRLRASMSHGRLGREFVGAASRLGLSKWHTARAMRGQKRTVSADWIAPLRAELGELRQRIMQQTGRPLVPGPGPTAWQPPRRGQGM
jgi:RsiW-degrading membrane proteinase PrsW (M82 family)